jgi:hypothetical protein
MFTKEEIAKFSPEQLEAFGHREAQGIQERQELLNRARGYRAVYGLVFGLVPSAVIAVFVLYPAGRQWALLVGLMVLVEVTAKFHGRLDAVTELLKDDLKQAADGKDSPDARVP